MGVPVISGRVDKIGDIWANVEAAIRREVRIDPSAYARLSYGYTGGASDNWDEVSAALDLVNEGHGQPTVAGLPTLLRFLRAKIEDRRFMQKEFGAWVYLDLHYEPTVIQYAEMRRRGYIELADGLRDWLRALGGYLAWAGCWGAGKTWAKHAAKDGPGARLLIGGGSYNPRTGGAPYCVLSGKRSLHFSGTWVENLTAPVLFASHSLGANLRQGDIWKAHNRFISTVEAVYGPLNIFTEEEQQKMLAASRNDISALEWCRKELIGDWLPAEQVTFIRTEHGVGQVLHESGKSATASIYYSGWSDDGTTFAAFADNGGRGGKGEQIEPGHAEINLEARTGWCQRTEGSDRVRVNFTLPTGNLVAVWTAKHGSFSAADYYRNGQRIGVGSSTPSQPDSSPREDAPTRPRETLLQKLWRWIRGG